MYIDQFPDTDIGRGIAAEHGVPIYHSIPGALTLGGDSLAVDGVLLIGEHGDYAWNEKQQHLFPRRYFMEQICGVMATSGRGVPVFNDKHLSWNWHDCRWMCERAASLGAPLMAGSSLPVAWRSPWLEHEKGVELEEALAVGFSGLDIYGFHTLEALQCMVERRRGGESGVAAVTCFEGDAVWEAAERGVWSRELAEAACAAIPDKPRGRHGGTLPQPGAVRRRVPRRSRGVGADAQRLRHRPRLRRPPRQRQRRSLRVPLPGPRRQRRARSFQLPRPQHRGDVRQRPSRSGR